MVPMEGKKVANEFATKQHVNSFGKFTVPVFEECLLISK